MTSIESELKLKAAELRKIISETAKKAAEPQEKLRISKSKNQERYYIRPADGKRQDETYYGREGRDKAKALAQADYENKLEKEAKKQLACIERFLVTYEESALDKVLRKMPQSRQELINPLVLDDEAYAAAWQNAAYSPKDIFENVTTFLTDRGEKVRSKSEKILADYYFKLGIPYRYECPLTVKAGNRKIIIHPDFTLLNKKTRRIIYHEHFGMMDSPEYCRNALERIELYIGNQIYPGESLLLTFEMSSKPLDMKTADQMIRFYCL